MKQKSIEQEMSIHNAKVYLTINAILKEKKYVYKCMMLFLLVMALFIYIKAYIALIAIYVGGVIGFSITLKIYNDINKIYILEDEWSKVIDANR